MRRKRRAASNHASTTIDMSAPILPDAPLIRVDSENPAALAFEEHLRTHRLVLSEDGPRFVKVAPKWKAPSVDDPIH